MSIYDACQSGRFNERSALATHPKDADLLVEAEGWASLAACKSDQSALELPDLGHGLFTYYLVRGLSGEATAQSDVITLDNLKDYVMSNTIETARQIGRTQTPLFSGEQTGALIMARRHTGTGPTTPELTRIIEHDITGDLPNSDTLDALLDDLARVVERPHSKTPMVISTSKRRSEITETHLGDTRVAFEALAERLKRRLGDRINVQITIAALSQIPGQEFAARQIYSSPARGLVDFDIHMGAHEITRDEWERPPGVLGLMGNDRFNRVQRTTTRPYPESIGGNSPALLVTIMSVDRSIPQVALVYAPLPLKVGLYLFVYFVTSDIQTIDGEFFPNDKGLRKHLGPLDPNAPSGPAPANLFAEFASYFREQIQSRAELVNRVF